MGRFPDPDRSSPLALAIATAVILAIVLLMWRVI